MGHAKLNCKTAIHIFSVLRKHEEVLYKRTVFIANSSRCYKTILHRDDAQQLFQEVTERLIFKGRKSANIQINSKL